MICKAVFMGSLGKRAALSVTAILAIMALSHLMLVSKTAIGGIYKPQAREGIGETELKARPQPPDNAAPKQSPSVKVVKEGKARSRKPVGDLHAVVIGVSKYLQPELNLGFADKDAEAFAEFLRGQTALFRHRHINLLVNEKATKTGIERLLYMDLKKAKKGDAVIIFLSGHGARDPHREGEFLFLPHDADASYPSATSIRMSHRLLVDGVDAKKVALIVDAAYSGFLGRDMRPLSKKIEDFSHECLVVMSACGADEVAQERSEFGHGIFTHYLLEGLSGKADTKNEGVVTLDEAYKYAYERCKAEGQHPHLFQSCVSGGFPLAVVQEKKNPATQ